MKRWAEEVIDLLDDKSIDRLMLRLRVRNSGVSNRTFGLGSLVSDAFYKSDETALDLIDALLFHGAALTARDRWLRADGWPNELRSILSDGGSVWTVATDGTGLVHSIDETLEDVYEEATGVEDDASNELREAWINAYGRNGDASDAWDHAIKAVEDVLIPVVVPKQDNATLGHVLGALRGESGAKWKMALPGPAKAHSVDALVGMLGWLWPNHDRHGGGPRRNPSIAEARMVVTCAAMIVQWHRQGWIIARR